MKDDLAGDLRKAWSFEGDDSVKDCSENQKLFIGREDKQ